ncbi:hypothetical protein BDZ97DRAFT_1812292 [Flammula alnicola]|nr:hypothetical protein BDZ97DRAFT_1812292 [Flammula alnicola]
MSKERQNIVIHLQSLAGQLDALNADVTLVTSRPFFTHLPASLRMVVTSEGALEESILMPFGDTYNGENKKVVTGEVASVVDDDTKGHYVVLDNGDQIQFSVLVLAPGSTWEGPLNFPNTKAEVLEWSNLARSVREAQDIILVGGGAVGLDKNVTIVHSQALPLNDTYPTSWRKKIAQQFTNRGIKFVLDDLVEDVPTRGGRPNTKFIETLGPDVLTATGHVKVTPTLQVVGHPRVFAAGDVIDWKEQKQAGKTPSHAAVIKTNILSLLGSKESLMILITNGKNGGTGYLGILWGITLGNWLAALLKSRSLMVDMTKKMLGFA